MGWIERKGKYIFSSPWKMLSLRQTLYIEIIKMCLKRGTGCALTRRCGQALSMCKSGKWHLAVHGLWVCISVSAGSPAAERWVQPAGQLWRKRLLQGWCSLSSLRCWEGIWVALSELSCEKTAKAAVQVLQGDELVPFTVWNTRNHLAGQKKASGKPSSEMCHWGK